MPVHFCEPPLPHIQPLSLPCSLSLAFPLPVPFPNLSLPLSFPSLTYRADEFGQLSQELAEPYYLYGKALLELARMENTVLGSGIPGVQGKSLHDR